MSPQGLLAKLENALNIDGQGPFFWCLQFDVVTIECQKCQKCFDVLNLLLSSCSISSVEEIDISHVHSIMMP